MSNFIQLTTALILHADPILPSHAATKQYVDNKRNNVNASSFTTGLITTARMPALSGDVSSVAGSGVISLNTNGVAAGSYAKVTVDATGRVTAGGALVASDIATVSWAKVTTGRPTTAAGYGITNLISLSGGTVGGNVGSTVTPSIALHAVTKGYVDNAISGVVSASLSAGDVIRKTATIAPSGFLRCNGSAISRAAYPALFSVIGTTHNRPASPNSAGKPWLNQWDFNNSQTASITGWTQGPSLPSTLYDSNLIVTANRVHLIGGVNIAGVYRLLTAPINIDGTLGSWVVSRILNDLPSSLYGQALVIKDKVIFITSNGGVYISTIAIDGTIGMFNLLNILPASVYYSQVIATSTRVYVLGGLIAGTTTNNTYSALINIDGTLGSWAMGAPMPIAVHLAHSVVTNNRVYVLGGSDSDYTILSAIQTAPINLDGTLGGWSISGALPNLLAYGNAVVTKNRVFIMGGFVSTGPSNVVYTAPVNVDGTLGTWSTGTPLSYQTFRAQAFVTSGRIYVVGGIDINNNGTNVISIANFSGGFNDYTPYTTQINTASTDFTLPDFSSLEKNSLNYFIKT